MIFHHPFRDNQYYFTEIAPFPEVTYPLEIGNTWFGALNIGGGWGIWDGLRIETKHEIIDKESISIDGHKYDDCWKIVSSASSEFGESFLTMWFHEVYGFVKLNYVTYANQILQIELDEVIEH